MILLILELSLKRIFNDSIEEIKVNNKVRLSIDQINKKKILRKGLSHNIEVIFIILIFGKQSYF